MVRDPEKRGVACDNFRRTAVDQKNSHAPSLPPSRPSDKPGADMSWICLCQPGAENSPRGALRRAPDSADESLDPRVDRPPSPSTARNPSTSRCLIRAASFVNASCMSRRDATSLRAAVAPAGRAVVDHLACEASDRSLKRRHPLAAGRQESNGHVAPAPAVVTSFRVMTTGRHACRNPSSSMLDGGDPARHGPPPQSPLHR